ncbi:MAG TPA: hypothetical protein VMN81_11680 [Vicinamibacterales bacterium]|nr:hypothetical protein [Vicinamibacterales bacterium]
MTLDRGVSRWTDRRLGRIIVAIVFVVVWGLITHGTHAGSGDEPHYTMIAHSIAFDGDLDLQNNYRDATLIGGGRLLPEQHVRARGDRLYPVHDIGWPLLMAPVVRVAYPLADYLGDAIPPAALQSARLTKSLLLRHQLSLVMALLTGFLARELFLLLIGLGIARMGAFAWSLLFALTPPVLSHAFLVFTEIPSALIAIAVARRLLAGKVSRGALIALGTTAGFLLLVHARNVGLVAGLVVMAALAAPENRRWKWAGLFAVGVAATAALRTAVTFALWGTFLTTPHASLGSPEASAAAREMAVRIAGLLVDREYGLLAYAPIYALALAGWVVFLRLRFGLRAFAVLVVVVAYLLPVILPVTNVHGWTGGWSPAARFLVPIAAFAWIPIAVFWARAGAVGKAVALALVVLQISMNAYLWQHPQALWNDGDGRSAVAWAAWLPRLTK